MPPYGVRFVSEKRVTIGRPKGPLPEGASVDAKRHRRRGRQRKLFEKSFLWNPSKTFGNRCRKAGVGVGKQAGFHSLFTGFSTGFPTFYCFSLGFPQAPFFTGFVPFVLFFLPGRAIFTFQCFCRLLFLKNFGALPFPNGPFFFSNPFVVTFYQIFNRHFRFSTPPRLFHRLVAKFSQTPRLSTNLPFFQRFSRGCGGAFCKRLPHRVPRLSTAN